MAGLKRAGLKRARFEFTDAADFRKQMDAGIGEVRFNFKRRTIEIFYECRKSIESEAAGIAPRVVAQRVEIDFSDEKILALILQNSQAIWDYVRDKPFLTDFSERDENGKIAAAAKSLEELRAEIYEVDFDGLPIKN